MKEIDLFHCEPCGDSRKGYIMHKDREPEVVPCWHCEDWFKELEIEEINEYRTSK